MNRKDFIRSLALAGLAPVSFYCTPPRKPTEARLTGPDAQTGHLLRDGQKAGSTADVLSVDTIIIGAGIAGLTAAYTLTKNGNDDYVLFELEREPGGNSSSRKNAVSEYPLGAHYLPIPNLNQPAMLDFLREAGIITDYDAAGRPVYREEYLCQEPEERLFIKNRWQEGLVPDYSVPEADKREIAAFLQRMAKYRQAKGSDGREAFCIPVMESSHDAEFLALDDISFKTFLEQNRWKSDYLHWYVDYCLRDDFGTRYEETSAWMGVHYFASRKGISANAEANDVLTWPEGNGKLVKELLQRLKNAPTAQSMVLSIDLERDGPQKGMYTLMVYEAEPKRYRRATCRNLVMAVPKFICDKLLPAYLPHPIAQKISCAPWLVANLTVVPFDADPRGVPLSWDNVIYGSTGLGYVNACHQHLKTVHEKYVLTYYKPLLDKAPAEMRKTVRSYTSADWKKMILDDLRTAHPHLEEYITDLEVYTTGHSMPQPKPRLMKEVLQQNLAAPENGLYFCHSDRSGYSIFEEAFYWGHRAAQHILQKQTV